MLWLRTCEQQQIEALVKLCVEYQLKSGRGEMQWRVERSR